MSERASGPARYRKKPVVIEAIRYTGTPENVNAIWDWAGADHFYGPVEDDPSGYIFTLEGKMECSVGDWVIQGIAGEYYPCKPDISEKTYEVENA